MQIIPSADKSMRRAGWRQKVNGIENGEQIELEIIPIIPVITTVLVPISYHPFQPQFTFPGSFVLVSPELVEQVKVDPFWQQGLMFG